MHKDYTMTKLLVTGASGHLGRLTLDALIDGGRAAPSDIIAVSRTTDQLAEYAAKGVEVRAGDFAKPETLPAAFAGADRIAIISLGTFPRIDAHKAAIAAAKEAGVSHILYTSLPRKDGVPATFGADHYETEDAIIASGVPYTFMRNSWYAENLFMSVPNAVASGKMFSAAGDGRLSYAPRQNFAEALAAALAADTTESKTYTLTGSESFSTDEVAALAARVLGKPIEVVHVSDEELAEGMKQAGVPEPAIPTLVSMDTNIRNGGLDIVTNDIEKLTGTPPMALEDFLKLSKDALLDAAK